MTSPVGRAIEESARTRLAQSAYRIEMDVPAVNTFEDLPLKPLTTTRSTHLTLAVQYIRGAKYPLPKLQDVIDNFSRGKYQQAGPRCGIWAKLDDVQSFQLTCIPHEDTFDIIKMARFKIRTSVKSIMAAFKTDDDTFMLDIGIVTNRNKAPVIMQKLFTGLGGNQVLDAIMVDIPVKKTKKPTASQQSLQEGFQYIRKNGPRSNNQTR